MSSEQSISSPAVASLTDSTESPKFRQLSITTILDEDHREFFTRAITRVLSTDIAETTYAQIIDGLPLASVVDDTTDLAPVGEHPIYNHTQLCPGILDKTREFRESFCPQVLQFDSRLLAAYQAFPPGSRAFNTRLIEMVAVAVHQIAVLLFNLNISVHKDDGIVEWTPPKSDALYWNWFPNGPLPTLFIHPWFLDYDQYPAGVADMVGYWAEAHILGGVVLFDRRMSDNKPGDNIDLDAVYFHSDREDVTYRIYQLLPEQKQALVEFFTAKSQPSTSPLPIQGDTNNRHRVDPEEPIKETRIYRDIWERKDRPFDLSDRRLRDVWDVIDFPTRPDRSAAWRRAADRKDQYYYGDTETDPES